jgi:hypothetical protein
MLFGDDLVPYVMYYFQYNFIPLVGVLKSEYSGRGLLLNSILGILEAGLLMGLLLG